MTRRVKNSIDTDSDADLLAVIEAISRDDDGAAAREHLAAGFPIYYSEDDTPAGAVIKEYPDGRRELVRFDREGEQQMGDVMSANPEERNEAIEQWLRSHVTTAYDAMMADPSRGRSLADVRASLTAEHEQASQTR